MSLLVDLKPEVESRLNDRAAEQGVAPTEFVTRLIEREVTLRPLTARELLKMPREFQDAYLAAAADAAPLYNEDLARPVAERELTAFTALDGEPIYEYSDDKSEAW